MGLYDLWMEPEVHTARRDLPGNFRQKIKHAIDQLATEPRPSISDAMDVAEIDVPVAIELRRLRLDPWRIIYAINNEEKWVWVLAVAPATPLRLR
jgi:mRNA-degrading endonuclease RelE of RelBE toxin-antitoxin system